MHGRNLVLDLGYCWDIMKIDVMKDHLLISLYLFVSNVHCSTIFINQCHYCVIEHFIYMKILYT